MKKLSLYLLELETCSKVYQNIRSENKNLYSEIFLRNKLLGEKDLLIAELKHELKDKDKWWDTFQIGFIVASGLILITSGVIVLLL